MTSGPWETGLLPTFLKRAKAGWVLMYQIESKVSIAQKQNKSHETSHRKEAKRSQPVNISRPIEHVQMRIKPKTF
jgi:hypothetical protein